MWSNTIRFPTLKNLAAHDVVSTGNQSTWRRIPKDLNIHQQPYEFKSRIVMLHVSRMMANATYLH